MNRQKILKVLAVFVGIILVLFYSINLFFRITDKKDAIKTTNDEIVKLKKAIKIEKEIQKEIKQKGDLESIYFIREENYFEKYIRELFDKYKIKMKVYHSRINEKAQIRLIILQKSIK